MKPIIGIVEWPYLDKDSDSIYEVSTNIVNKVIDAGGIPVGIFPTKSEDYINKSNSEIDNLTVDESDELLSMLDRVDAIIKPGALRIYNYEKFIYNYTLVKNIPYLGICAGMQLMTDSKNELVNGHKDVSHKIRIYRGTLLSSILQRDEIEVMSKHRYRVSDNGINRISAKSYDSTIEALENPNCLFNLGLQWHPELDNTESTERIFNSLVENAKVYKKIK